MIKKNILLLLSLLCIPMIFAHNGEQQEFLESFIRYYDFTSVGRYTHEYHPFLFEKSSYSLDELEESLKSDGFDIKGRVVIAGYEEQAVPNYSSNYKVCTGHKINDEAWAKGMSGWSSQLHNKFGLMTGFLFRDIPHINFLCGLNENTALFEHINLDLMPIFDYDSWIFQKHAFGKMLSVMQDEQAVMNWYVQKKETKKIFSELINFWKILYEYELRHGNRKVLGTQDVLFSIAHAQHLYRSDVPLFKYYLGPDITYPIKVTKLQKKGATYHAQTFVKNFSKHMKAIDDEPTVYIFCSFVDGVGKSTLLGNVQNYKKFGDQFALYESVDNSSSQLAQLYKYDDNIFIADLPAQMSHFTYKPDGMVYFDIHAAGVEDADIKDVEKFIFNNKESLVSQKEILERNVHITVMKRGWFAEELTDPLQPEKAFLKNVLLLKREQKNNWIPCEYKGKHYLFHRYQPNAIRMLVKLEFADSLGLKNYEAEQMLFFEGIRFPLNYKIFVDDLLSQLKNNRVKNVVFVDFLSMYPRSSRENIRINYLMQQLSLLYSSFSIENSSYATFVDDAQLFYKLKKDKERRILQSFQKEALVRLSLYSIMKQYTFNSIDGMDLAQVTRLLQKNLSVVDDELLKGVDILSREKVQREMQHLEKVHGKTKNFVNIQELDFYDVLAVSKAIENIFTNHVANERLRFLWYNAGDIVGSYDGVEGAVNKTIKLSDGTFARLLFVISPACKNKTILSSVLHALRASWYMALSNIVGAPVSGSSFDVQKERYFVAPIWVKQTKSGKIAVIRREFVREEKEIEPYQMRTKDFVDIPGHRLMEWGIYNGKQYLLNGEYAQTDRRLFAYGCSLLHNAPCKWPKFDSLISYFVKKHKKKEKADIVMPTSMLWEYIENDYWWKKSDFKKALDCAKKNEERRKRERDNQEEREGQGRKRKKQQEKNLIRLGQPEQVESCRLFIRGLATIEMFLKDANGDVALRRGNKNDFIAALRLFEKIILPQYFHLVFEHDLFEDYNHVEPLIEFDEWFIS